MTSTSTRAAVAEVAVDQMSIGSAATLSAQDVLAALGSSPSGLSTADVEERRRALGPNAVPGRSVHLWRVLAGQVRSPLLILLLLASAVSYAVGERADAVIIAVIVALSVGLGAGNEYRAELTAARLHDQIRHRTVAVRDGRAVEVDVVDLVPGDVVDLSLGDIVPADVRLINVNALACDESVLTGESMAVDKATSALGGDRAASLSDLGNSALMGTVVHNGSARGVVVATGAHTEFGGIAAGLRSRPLETEFQTGLRKYAMLLVYVAGTLSAGILIINIAMDRPLIDAVLFSLAIAVGITPQLLPAVVATSLAQGSHRLTGRKVLVKRLVCIEDLGNVDILFTDKTGTLTIGEITFMRAIPAAPLRSADVLRYGLLGCGDDVHANPLDAAITGSPAAIPLQPALQAYRPIASLPFDHERARSATLVRELDDGNQLLIVKGAPESILHRCRAVPPDARAALDEEFRSGHRVVAVATRTANDLSSVTAADETDLELAGFLIFLDPAKPDAINALRRLADLGVSVKIITGDNAIVATKLCSDLGLPGGATMTGTEIEAMGDADLTAAIAGTTVFARVTPAQKARIVRLRRNAGGDVAFLGDGVNDALALHAADVGISVDSAAEVAKDAADVILLEKSLDVLADGVVEGRRIFANTIKYVLMGTSSNFGNMFSAAGASLVLPFLPMLPSQILLNNLLYDTSQLAIPTDEVDAEQLRKPAHWDIRFIRRFMLYFGPFSSIFDFVTFGIMRWGFHAGPTLFRSGWFVESLATQTLVIFAIRTRRVPFFRSRPSLTLTCAAIGVVAIGAALPASPLAGILGFSPLPAAFFAALCALVLAYLVLVEIGKWAFYRASLHQGGTPLPRRSKRHVRRRAAGFMRHTSMRHTSATTKP
jgi:Mg2+-importing ATPase